MSDTSPPTSPDVIQPETMKDLAAHRGPALSMFVPAPRSGTDTLQGPTRVRNLVRSARDVAQRQFGDATATALLDPLQALAEDVTFWQHQFGGLAVLTSPDDHHVFRLSSPLSDAAVVGDRYRLRPLLEHAGGVQDFYVLSLAQNGVRVFAATPDGIDELHGASLPSSMDEALWYEDAERQLQSRAVGGGDAVFHGHGAGKELDKQALERFFRAVDGGVIELLGPTARPVVLACVEYYVPIYRSVTGLPNVVPTAIAGNPEHLSPAELRDAAVALLAPLAAAPTVEVLDRYGALTGTGRAIDEVDAIAAAAIEGRIDALLIALDDGTTIEDNSGAAIDRAIADAIATGARAFTVDPSLLEGRPLAAVLRY